MFTQEQDMSPWSMPQTAEPNYNAQGMPAMLSDTIAYQPIYPDVYYKVQPFVMMACDEMDAYGCMMPNHDMLRQTTDRIYHDIGRMHPELAEVQSLQIGEGGFFNDLITIMLLNEFFHRRRRF